MIASVSRTGGCGCAGRGPRERPGACACTGPERCGVSCLERPVYSAGQLLTADVLRLGQRYLEERLALRRYVDGVGVVCGLHVRCDPERPGWVVVEPGYAVDCCGNDLVLCEPVRMDLCGAIARCPRPPDPCGDAEARLAPGPDLLPPAGPGTVRTGEAGNGVLSGTVLGPDGASLAGAQVKVEGGGWSATTDWDGSYNFPIRPGTYGVTARHEGFRAATREVTVESGMMTEAGFQLASEASPDRVGSAPRRVTYVLRAEPVWEGREPVPVITQRGSCDPRPECRPSRETGSLRLCVEPEKEIPAGERAADRARDFRAIGQETLRRLGDALASPEGTRAFVETLLHSVRDEPPRSACAMHALLCELRRVLAGDMPRCRFSGGMLGKERIPDTLVWAVGFMVDDLRRTFLAAECDDCCERTGVRLAHVVVEPELAGCGDADCPVAWIDDRPPGRETLHPRDGWWWSERVSLHDAYFRPAAEAGVLLSARGLEVSEKALDADGGSVRSSVLARLDVYGRSELYAPYASRVTLWTAGGRVVAVGVDWPDSVVRGPAAAPAATALDPAPFSGTISGVGDKLEAHLFRAGIRTFAALADADYDAVRTTLGPRVPLAREALDSIRNQARDIADGRHAFPPGELEQRSAEARRRLDAAEGRTP